MNHGQAKESFCFAVLNIQACGIAEGGNPVLAYNCHAVNTNDDAADGTVHVPILVTDAEGARREKAAILIAQYFDVHFSGTFNLSLSTVIFG
jgi:hypothetical protein